MGCGPKTFAPQNPSGVSGDPNGILRWKDVLQKDPWRLDARFRLADLYQEQSDFELQYDLWARTLQMGDGNLDRFHWENGGLPPQRPSRSIPSHLQDSIDHYLGRKTQEATARALRLSKLGATYFPSKASFERSRAVCYSRRGDAPAALRCLLRLLQRDPKNSKTLLLVGETLEDTGKKKEARLYYRKVKALGIPGEAFEKAKTKLGED